MGSSWAADYNEPSTYFNMLRTGDSNNQGKFSHADYDALLDRAVNAGTSTAWNNDYHQAEKILQQQISLLPIYYYVRAQLVKPYVGGFKPDQKADVYSKDI
ncbi:hypothetical protein BIY29_13900 [Brenneria alni]|uniref:Solute-binding protein family 5 domain-containing protein n=1 Tax=Brenneria alni TaxID=71656 RepID=A0A421DLJ1_9GAMM|nr:hypothetical protein [Brenneria alni]RLM21248.1 hypothetical protein BIY29_13900 [Brenneria alni]